ncbi:hypothetical protein BgiBS90_037933 [Biomphalaria glabrata]|nr:hypothetical protein BgiBS90_037933 [Biomphalaria glabrata]
MGHCISAQGIKPETKKIKAILEMKKPENSQEARKLCGMWVEGNSLHIADTLSRLGNQEEMQDEVFNVCGQVVDIPDPLLERIKQKQT